MRLTHRTYDSADRPNAPTASAGLPDYRDARNDPTRPMMRNPASPGPAPSIIAPLAAFGLAVGAAVAIPLFRVLWAASEVAKEEYGFLLALVRITFVAAALGVALGALGLLRWLWKRGDAAGLVELPGGALAPVDALKERPEVFGLEPLRLHYEVQRTWADRSALRGLSTYAPSSSWTYEARGGSLDQEAPPPAAPPIDFNSGDILGQLVRGGFTRPDRLLVGFNAADGAPVAIDLRRAGMVAVAGQSGTGKSSTAALLVAQAVYHNAAVLVCDPHGDLDEGLLHRLRPLSGRLERQAVAPGEITAAISLAHKIARRRLSGQDAADTPVVLVIDEFTGQIVNGGLTDQTFHQLLSLSTEARKARVLTVLIAHDWSARMLGDRNRAAAMRRACTHRILHRSDPMVADLLLPDGTYGARVASLKPGQALILADGEAAEVAVPYLKPDDLAAAARGAPERPYRPRTFAAAPAAPALHAPPSPPAARTPPRNPDVRAALQRAGIPDPPPVQTMAERIKALLADGNPRDSLAIAAQLGADKQVVFKTLWELANSGDVVREGTQRNYIYRIPKP